MADYGLLDHGDIIPVVLSPCTYLNRYTATYTVLARGAIVCLRWKRVLYVQYLCWSGTLVVMICTQWGLFSESNSKCLMTERLRAWSLMNMCMSVFIMNYIPLHDWLLWFAKSQFNTFGPQMFWSWIHFNRPPNHTMTNKVLINVDASSRFSVTVSVPPYR